MRDALLAIHILAVCLWFGGSIMNGVLNANVMKQNDAAAAAGLARAEAKLGVTFYMPMAVITLLSGLLLVFAVDGAPWSLGDPWISLGFLTIIVAAVMGPVKFQPLTDKMIAAYEAGQPEEGKRLGMEIGKFSSITTGLLFLSIVAMVWKPGT